MLGATADANSFLWCIYLVKHALGSTPALIPKPKYVFRMIYLPQWTAAVIQSFVISVYMSLTAHSG